MKTYYITQMNCDQFGNEKGSMTFQKFTDKQEALNYFNQVKKDTSIYNLLPDGRLETYLDESNDDQEESRTIKSFIYEY